MLQSEVGEFQATSALGWRAQPADWENSSVPTLHLDGVWRPDAWPFGGKVALDLTGFTGDLSGEQTASVAVGLARTVELVPDVLGLSLGAGRAFLDTERDDIFSSSGDSWQATYVEAGLQVPLSRKDNVRFGTELRYAWGDGPELEGEELAGEALDFLVLVCFAP